MNYGKSVLIRVIRGQESYRSLSAVKVSMSL